MKYKAIFAIVVCLILIGTAVFVYNLNYNKTIDEKEDTSSDEPFIITGNISSFDDAVNVFCFNLFRQMYFDSDIDKNIFLSPYSIFVALAMTYEGAKESTAEEMADVLNILQDNESFHQYVQVLYDYFNINSEYNISTANALWVDDSLELLDDYLNIIYDYYHGNSTEVDFDKPVEAAEIINSWVENQTNNLIKDLIQPDDITPLTALILTNAIYFKGIWKVQFDSKNTTDRDFEDFSGDIISVPTMCLTNTEDLFNYTENEDLQILELPYTGDEISMIVLLPKDNDDFSGIINSIDNDNLTEWINSMTEREVNIYLPKFKVETDNYVLNDYLVNLGMPSAFEPNFADFSGMTGLRDLYISKVVHKAFIDVNEEGTEAAAATAVIMAKNAIDGENGRVVFDADHPFLYLIRHKETGTILFMGAFDSPSSQ
jgi:serpin B